MVYTQVSSKKFPLYTFSGSNQEIAQQMSSVLKERIIATRGFYKFVFNKDEEDIFRYARYFQRAIKDFNRDYTIEIETLAEGIEIDPLWLYALNSRSEIMNKFANECTSSYFSENKLLGQNWDWAKELEELSYIAKLKQPDKPDILQIAEPGILGKIGFNSAGLGVTLNFLHLDGYDPKGVPIHVLLRGILDCSTIDEAKKLVETHSIGRTANLIVADRFGNYFDVEFAGDEQFFLDNTDAIFVHTNHYMGKKINTDKEEFASSFARFERASEIAKGLQPNANLSEFKQMLLDKSNFEFPICRTYLKPKKSLLENSGTVCSLIMDLQKLQMHITRGNPYEYPFEKINLN